MNAIKMGMTIEEAAETSGIGRNTMRKLVDWGKLPVLKVGRKTIIRRDMMKRASGYAPRKRSPMKAAKSVRAVPLSPKAAYTNSTFSP